ncbi:MAG: hypothetical protein QM817_34715 [Archangium sp.]
MSHLVLALLLSQSAPSDLEKRALEASARGVEHARAGRFEAALEQFKQAEALIPRRENLCNIALTYGRMKRWPQAWLFLEECRLRSVGTQPPTWFKDALATAEHQLSIGPYALVVVRATEDATLVLFPGLGLEEAWKVVGERKVWLTNGAQDLRFRQRELEWTQHIEAAAGLVVSAVAPPPVVAVVPEKVEKTEPDKVEPDKTDNTTKTDIKTEKTVLTEPPPPSRPLAGPLVTGGLGVAAAIVGTIFYGVARGSQAEANALEAGPAFDLVAERFGRERVVTYGGWIAGAALVVTGVVWWLVGAPAPQQVMSVLRVRANGLQASFTW